MFNQSTTMSDPFVPVVADNVGLYVAIGVVLLVVLVMLMTGLIVFAYKKLKRSSDKQPTNFIEPISFQL